MGISVNEIKRCFKDYINPLCKDDIGITVANILFKHCYEDTDVKDLLFILLSTYINDNIQGDRLVESDIVKILNDMID